MKRPRRRQRRGFLMLLLLVGIVVETVLLGSLARVGLLRRERALDAARPIQAEWLAAAGLSRARAELHAAPAYAGETWRVPADELDGHSSGVVIIRVTSLPERPNSRRVFVEATFPAEGFRKARREGMSVIDL